MGRWQGGHRKITHAPWVHAAYVRWLYAGGPDVWEWLSHPAHEYPLSRSQKTEIINLRRSLIDAVSEPDLHL